MWLSAFTHALPCQDFWQAADLRKTGVEASCALTVCKDQVL